MGYTRTLPEPVTALREAYPEDFCLSGCLTLPTEPDDEAFPPVVKLHDNCGCAACWDCHLPAVRARAALVRSHIVAGRQHLLV